MATTNKLMILEAERSGTLSVSTTSATVDLSSLITGSEDTIRIAPNVDCYVRMTNGSGTAVTTDVLILSGSAESFGVPPDATHLSAVAVSHGTLNYFVSKGI